MRVFGGFIALVMGCGLVSEVNAQSPLVRRGLYFARFIPGSLIARLDTNADSKVSQAEFLAPAVNASAEVQAALLACFVKIDANADGFITVDEVGKRPTPITLAELFASLDVNSDTKLSPAEFAAQTGTHKTPAQLTALFAQLDVDADGFLTLAEFSAKPRRPTVADLFAKVDTDADGKISPAEFLAICPRGSARFTQLAQATFRFLDVNSDGYLTLAEYTALR